MRFELRTSIRLGTFLFCAVFTVLCDKRSDYYDVSKGPLVTHKVWFNITIGNRDAGRIVIGLFGRTARDTVWNFVDLAKPRPYESHRGGRINFIDKGVEIAGGNDDCDSDYGEFFPKDNTKLQHYGAGWVGMISFDKESSRSCVFYIILKPLHAIDGRNVVFGKVLNGMKVVKKIANVEVYPNRWPKRDIIISECGTELADPPFKVARIAATD